MATTPRPPFLQPPSGLLASAFLFGFASGLVVMVALLGMQYVPMNNTWAVFLILPVLLVPIIVFVCLTRSYTVPSIRVRWVLGAAGLFCLGAWCAGSVEWASHRPVMASPLWLFSGLLPMAIVALVAASLWGETYAMRRRSYVAALRARPNSCFACRYDLSGLSLDALCPECGRARWQHPGRAKLLLSDRKRRTRLLNFALAFTAVGAAVFFLRWRLEIIPLERRLAGTGSTEYYDLPGPSPAENPHRLAGRGVIVRSPRHSDRQLLVIIPEGTGEGLPNVRLWLTFIGRMGGDPRIPEFPLQLDPPVVCDLDQGQAAKLFATGIPPELFEAMFAAGQRSRPGVMWICTDDLATTPARAVKVDGGAYFP